MARAAARPRLVRCLGGQVGAIKGDRIGVDNWRSHLDWPIKASRPMKILKNSEKIQILKFYF